MKTLDDEFDEAFDRVLKEVIDFMKKSDKVFKELAMSTSKITSFEKETAKIERPEFASYHSYLLIVSKDSAWEPWLS